jgi:quercetin dioxygenase-like cupin family protein
MTDSQVINLVDHIQVAEGAVVSKTLLKKTAGSVTLFAFDQGQELSEHTAPYDALVQVLDGSAAWRIGGEAVTVSAGESVLLLADVPHGVVALTPFKMLLTMIRASA